jgi:uncharacterized protein
MPLNHAKGAKARSENIAELIRAGHSPEQAAAIAYKVNGEDEAELEDDCATDQALHLALDRSMRAKDLDGHLHVESVNISKANVCPYMGSEIPNGAELGLDPTRVYMLYRDAAELEASAPTFENKQLMIKHVGVSALSPQEWLTVGVVSGVHWSAPYLKARLTVWNQKGIDAIESKAQSELSSGYRYKADMTPGTVDGVHYDGIMRSIVGNHVALVTEGRVGPDVFVTDETPQEFYTMKISALSAAMIAAGLIATDKKPEDVTALLSEQFALDKKAKDEAKEKAEAEDKAACDAAAKAAGCDSKDMVKGEDGKWVKGDKAKDENDDDMDAEDIDLVTAERGGVKPKVSEGGADAKAAQDAAIKAAVDAALAKDRALIAARAEVAPVLGVVAYDSAEDVYKAALAHLKVDHADVHASAYRALFAAHVKTAAAAPVNGDAATVKTLDQAFPGFNRLSRR